jgi:hypothetical protein
MTTTGSDDKKLTAMWARNLKTRMGVERLSCYRCGRSIRLGARVHVHHSIHRRTVPLFRIYHQACWESLFISC